jgi:hypothetical protein
MALGDAGREVKGKLANGVGSQYSSHYLGTWCTQHYYRWCAHLSCQIVDWTDSHRRFKWTRPLRRKTRCGFCACAIRFRTSSIHRVYRPVPSVDRFVHRAVVTALKVFEGRQYGNTDLGGTMPRRLVNIYWDPSSRVQTRTKQLDFSGIRKILSRPSFREEVK